MLSLATLYSSAPVAGLTSTSSGTGDGSSDLGALMVIILVVISLALLFSSGGETVVVVERSSGFGWLLLVISVGAFVFFLGSSSGLT